MVVRDVDLVDEVGGTAISSAHGRAVVDVVVPTIELVIAFEGEMEALVLGLQQQTVGLDICALDVGDVTEVDDLRRPGGELKEA